MKEKEEEGENLERLVETVIELGFPKTNMREYIEGCEGLEEIPFFHRRKIGDDQISYLLTIKSDKETGLYYPLGYEATLLQTHPIAHGHFNGIDTRQLEQRLKEVNWNDYEPRSNLQDDTISRIIEDVDTLAASQDKQARDISRRLQLRYWLHTPVEQERNVAQYKSNYQKYCYFPLNNGFADINTREAYHLLSRRAVLKFYQKEGEPQHFYTHWKAYDKGKLVTFPDYDLVSLLKKAGVSEASQDGPGAQLIYELIRGRRPLVHIKKDKSETATYIEADPRQQSLKFYDSGLNTKEIPELKKYVPHRYQINIHKKKQNKNRGRSL